MFLIPELLYSVFALVTFFCNCYLKLSLSFYFSENLIKYTLKHQFFFNYTFLSVLYLCHSTLSILWIHLLVLFLKVNLFQLEANYFTILWWFLPCIDMNQPWVYICPPSWTPLPYPSPSHPSALTLSTLFHQTWTGHLFHIW